MFACLHVSEINEFQQRWAYPFKIPVYDPEFVEVGYTGRGLRELKGCWSIPEETATKLKVDPQIANGLPLGWMLNTASHSHLTSTQRECGDNGSLWTYKFLTEVGCSDGIDVSSG